MTLPWIKHSQGLRQIYPVIDYLCKIFEMSQLIRPNCHYRLTKIAMNAERDQVSEGSQLLPRRLVFI